ncbi:MAG: FtsW/RodA/SpoVE family cell cycle protein [Bacilli bacterium]|nr:FtsW/RodA/SpoVE family cell cycle protein [Bacilli bacterium]
MKRVLKNLNYPLLLLTIVYSIFGCIMVFSASSVAAVLRYQVSTNYFFIRQVIWILIGSAVGIFAMFFPTKNYNIPSKVAMAVVLGLLFFVFTFGRIAGGAQSWYKAGFFNFQPTELAKIVLILFLACYYHDISQDRKISLWDMLFPLIISAIEFVMIAMQPDFGGAFIIFGIVALIFISLPIAKKHKKKVYKVALGAFLILLFGVFVLGKNILQSYQVKRILYFQNPCERYADEDGTGYQVCNGYIAIHNGGLTGVGLGKSTQKYLYLPEAHTDFIFPIICEELGLVAGILVVLGYFVMLVLILIIAKNAVALRNSILTYGIFAYLLLHILINLLGVLGLIPLTGVPLPLLSYGGSFNVIVLASLGIVQRVNIENKKDKIMEKIKKL